IGRQANPSRGKCHARLSSVLRQRSPTRASALYARAVEVGEKVAVGKGGAATSPEQDEQSNEVEAVRVEIYTQVPGVSREDHRQMSPLSGDAVRVWAVIWARPRGSSEAPRPYSSNQRSFPEAVRSLYCIGRGGANGDAPQRPRARPDLTGQFRPPNLES